MILPVKAQLSFGEPVKINDNWLFHQGDCNALKSPGLVSWRQIDLPHDWSSEGEPKSTLSSCTGYLPGGIGWYLKDLPIPANRSNDKVYLYFEGIYNHSEVYLNGHLFGKRPNGYISFAYDATPFIAFGKKNTITVRVDHSKSEDSRWYTGSGIYRNVWVIYSNPVHFSQWGVVCATQSINSTEAKLKIDADIENGTKYDSELDLQIQIVDKDGKISASRTGKVAVEANKHKNNTIELNVSNPLIWSIDHPNLYTLHATLSKDSKVIDQVNIPIGIRSLTFDPNKGFALNGQWMKVKGVCIHHDAGVLGAAVPIAVWERRLLALKQIGCNAIRLSHNPQMPELYDLFDRLGFLVMDEAFDEWEFAKRKWLEGWNKGKPGYEGSYEYFNEWSDRDLADMVRRDRNHPSIFCWSIGNEIDYPNDPYSHPILNGATINQPMYGGYKPNQPSAERLGTIAKRLVSVVKQYDTTRPVTAALAGVVMSNHTEYPGALDITGYNYTEKRYAEDHQKYPNRIIYGSENGQGLNEWKSVRDNEFIFGQFLWSGIDFLGEAGAWPSRGSVTGLLDMAGFMKPKAYFRQSIWSSIPMVYIATQNISRKKDGRDLWPAWNFQPGDTVKVTCYTNAAKVQLVLNGKPVGNPRLYDDNTGNITWEIPFQEGKLEAIGYDKNDQPICRNSIESAQAPYAIVAKLYKNNLTKDDGLSQIVLQIVDKDGIPVALAENEIICRVKGNAKFLGMEAGNSRDMTSYKSNKRKTLHGRLLCYIQGANKKGTATVQFSSPGLKSTSVEIQIK